MLKTEENLSRLNDIILELNGRLDPLRIQAEKAEKYLILREKVTFLEVDGLLKDYDKCSLQLSALHDDQKKYHQEKEMILAELKALDLEKCKIEKDIESYNTEKEVLQIKIQEIKNRQEEQKTTYLLNCQKKEHLAEQKERLLLNHEEANRDKEKEAVKLDELNGKLLNRKENLMS